MYYLRHLLTELPQLLQSYEELEESVMELLMPWSKMLPEECYIVNAADKRRFHNRRRRI